MNTTHVVISSPEDASRLSWESTVSLTLVGDSVQVEGLLSYRNNIREVKFLDNTFVADRIFQHCNNIQKVTFSSSTVHIGNYAFNECHSLEELSFSQTKIARIGSFAFNKCTSLTKLHLSPDTHQLGVSCFQNCTSLMEVVFPHNSGIEIVPEMAFASCSSLTSLELGEVKEIRKRAFDSCGLTEVNIPDTVNRLGDMVFLNCTQLRKLNIGNNSDIVLGNHVFDILSIKELYCAPVLLTRYDFSNIPVIVCDVIATTLSGDRYPFKLTLPLESKDFNPDQQLLRQSEIDTDKFDLIVDDAPLRLSLNKVRLGQIDLDNIVIIYNPSTDLTVKGKVQLVYNHHRSVGGAGDSTLTVSDIPGLEYENVDNLIAHGFHTLTSLIGVLLTRNFDNSELINFVTRKSRVEIANKVADAINVAMNISTVYVPGNIYQSELLEFMTADETRKRTSRLIPFDRMETLGSIDNLPVKLTDAERARFREKGVTDIYHIIGHYFEFNRDPDLIEMFLLDFVNQEKADAVVNFIHRDMIFQQL